MRRLLAPLALIAAVPMVPTMAAADSHSCAQLRQTLINQAPITTRNLPYGALSCTAVSHLHLLVVRGISNTSAGRLEDRIEAIFRREGLIR